MSTLQPRLTALASTLAAGSALASAAMIGGAPITPVHSPFLDSIHKNVALTGAGDLIAGSAATDLTKVPDPNWVNPDPTGNPDATAPTLDTTTFGGSLQWLLDSLKIGNTQFADLVPSNVTVEGLLAGSHLGVSSSMTDVFNQLGLQNFTMGEIFKDLGLPVSTTLDDLIGKLPSNMQTVDGLMAGLTGNLFTGDTDLAELVDKVGFGDKTVAELMQMVGFPGTTTVDGLMTNLGLGELQGLLGAMGVTSATNLAGLIGMLGSHAGSLTLDQLMNAATSGSPEGAGFLSTVGDITLNKLLGITSSTTTMASVLDGMTFTTTSAGGTEITSNFGALNLGNMVGLVNITPSMTLATLLGDLPLGVGSHANLGADTLGEMLGALANGNVPDASTGLGTFIGEIFTNGMTLDQLLGLG